MTGGDFASNVAQLARENQLLKEVGLFASIAESRPEKNERGEKEDEGMEENF